MGKNDENAAFQDLVMWDCNNMPQLEMSDSFGHWLEMNGLQASQFNSICDNVGERWKAKKGASMMEDSVDKSTQAPTSAVLSETQSVIGVVVGVLALVGVVVGVGFYIQKTKQSHTDSEIEYNKM